MSQPTEAEKIEKLAKWLDYQFEGPQVGNQVRAIGADLVIARDRVAELQAKLDEAAAALNVALAHATGQMPRAATPADVVRHYDELAGCRIVLDSLTAPAGEAAS